MKADINMGTIWTMLVGTAMAIIYMFNTFAKAEDVQAINYRILKSEIREIRAELRDKTLETETRNLLELDLQELIDDLCLIQPLDRECKADGDS